MVTKPEFLVAKKEMLVHMNSLTASRRHIKAYQDASNQPPKWVY